MADAPYWLVAQLIKQRLYIKNNLMDNNVKFEKYEKHYNEDNFWEKVKKFAEEFIETDLKFWYSLNEIKEIENKIITTKNKTKTRKK